MENGPRAPDENPHSAIPLPVYVPPPPSAEEPGDLPYSKRLRTKTMWDPEEAGAALTSSSARGFGAIANLKLRGNKLATAAKDRVVDLEHGSNFLGKLKGAGKHFADLLLKNDNELDASGGAGVEELEVERNDDDVDDAAVARMFANLKSYFAKNAPGTRSDADLLNSSKTFAPLGPPGVTKLNSELKLELKYGQTYEAFVAEAELEVERAELAQLEHQREEATDKVFRHRDANGSEDTSDDIAVLLAEEKRLETAVIKKGAQILLKEGVGEGKDAVAQSMDTNHALSLMAVAAGTRVDAHQLEGASHHDALKSMAATSKAVVAVARFKVFLACGFMKKGWCLNEEHAGLENNKCVKMWRWESEELVRHASKAPAASDNFEAWRAAKEKEWDVKGSKLRRKHLTREKFEAWMDEQVNHWTYHTKVAGAEYDWVSQLEIPSGLQKFFNGDATFNVDKGRLNLLEKQRADLKKDIEELRADLQKDTDLHPEAAGPDGAITEYKAQKAEAGKSSANADRPDEANKKDDRLERLTNAHAKIAMDILSTSKAKLILSTSKAKLTDVKLAKDGSVANGQAPDAYSFTEFHHYVYNGGQYRRQHEAMAPWDEVAWFQALDRYDRGVVDSADFVAWMRMQGCMDPKPLGFLGAVSVLLRTRTGRVIGTLITLALFFTDIVTDILVTVDLLDEDGERYDPEASLYAAVASITIMAMLPVFQSLVDIIDENSMDWWLGLPLNFTYLRLVYFVLVGSSSASSKAIGDAKLIEAIIESMPQLLVQAAALAANLVAFDLTIMVSLSLSLASIAHAAALKMYTVYKLDKWDNGILAAVVALLYFAVDSASRGIAVNLTVAKHGMRITPFVPVLGPWISAEAIYRGLCHHYYRASRAKRWVIDPSVVSGVLALFSALPLSNNSTERRWLFVTSTVATSAAAYTAGLDADADAGAVLVFVCCIVVKLLLFATMERALGINSTYQQTLSDDYGKAAFSFDVDLTKQQQTWKVNDWAEYFEGEARRRGPNVLKLTTRPGASTAGMVAWLSRLDRKDMLSSQDVLWFKGVDKEQTKAERAHFTTIELHKEEKKKEDTIVDAWPAELTLSLLTKLKRVQTPSQSAITAFDLKKWDFIDVPNVVTELKHLQKLTITSCSQITKLPTALSGLTALQSLDLSGNKKLNDVSAIKSLVSLQTLDLSQTPKLAKLSGEWFQKLTSLKKLNLGGNPQLKNKLPEELCRLKNLQELDLTGIPPFVLPKSFDALANKDAIKPKAVYRPDEGKLDWHYKNVRDKYTRARPLRLTELPLANLETLALADLADLKEWDLGDNNLSELPPMFGTLAKLKRLDLSNNANLSTLPKEVLELRGLKELVVKNTKITDHLDLSDQKLRSVPVATVYIVGLKALSLQNNQLGSVLSTIGNLTSLQSLNLSGNQLQGLPAQLGKLTKLVTLNLGGNQLQGLPAQLEKLTKLETLNLGGNPLKWNLTTSTLGKTLGKLVKLINLDLGKNSELSSLPAEIGQLTSLRTLTLNSNLELSSLPAEIGQLASLETLDLRDNPKLNSLPAEINKLPKLNKLDLSETRAILELDWSSKGLTSVSAAVAQITTLQTLNLDGNKITELPREIGQLSLLQTLSLNGNKVTELPREIGQLTSLHTLTLNSNKLAEIPDEIGQLSVLQTLNLNDNKVTELPSEIGQLSVLKTLSLNGNKVTELPLAIGKLSVLQTLNLNDNKVTELPSEIGQLTSLHTLALNSNKLAEIPDEIGQLSQLKHLHLNKNQLPGLPAAVAKLGLEELHLEGNPNLDVDWEDPDFAKLKAQCNVKQDIRDGKRERLPEPSKTTVSNEGGPDGGGFLDEPDNVESDIDSNNE